MNNEGSSTETVQENSGGPKFLARLPMHPFLKELLANPAAMGAACPSSPSLAHCMASFVPFSSESYVLEIGAGSGAVTAALLQRGIPPDRLLAVERAPQLAAHLSKTFPGLRVIQGDATALNALLHQEVGSEQPALSAIVSSLPFRSLPLSVVEEILNQVQGVMTPQTKLIQFTYDLRPTIFLPLQRFKRIENRIIWLNLPPARVDVFHRL